MGAGIGIPAGHVLLGEFGRAHGLAGEVRLKSYTEDPLAIGRYGPLRAEDGRLFTLRSLRQAAGGQTDVLVARVEGISNRTGAEALNRLRLHAAREKLGATADEDEFFLADLIGLAVEGPAGPIGTVVGVPNYGSGDLLEIAPAAGGHTMLLPFTKRFVPAIDLAGRRIVVDPLTDLLDDEQTSGDRPPPGVCVQPSDQ